VFYDVVEPHSQILIGCLADAAHYLDALLAADFATICCTTSPAKFNNKLTRWA
jgi:hypothetical protein